MVVQRGNIVNTTPAGVHLLAHNYHRHQHEELGSSLRADVSTGKVVVISCKQNCVEHSGNPGNDRPDCTDQEQVGATAYGQLGSCIVHAVPGRDAQVLPPSIRTGYHVVGREKLDRPESNLPTRTIELGSPSPITEPQG